MPLQQPQAAFIIPPTRLAVDTVLSHTSHLITIIITIIIINNINIIIT
jgi:hypothetical protein